MQGPSGDRSTFQFNYEVNSRSKLLFHVLHGSFIGGISPVSADAVLLEIVLLKESAHHLNSGRNGIEGDLSLIFCIKLV